jgi:hypothetical protein
MVNRHKLLFSLVNINGPRVTAAGDLHPGYRLRDALSV